MENGIRFAHFLFKILTKLSRCPPRHSMGLFESESKKKIFTSTHTYTIMAKKIAETSEDDTKAY